MTASQPAFSNPTLAKPAARRSQAASPSAPYDDGPELPAIAIATRASTVYVQKELTNSKKIFKRIFITFAS
ncbi:hypothetical protein L484_007081 [Morus notabilis]|uniref:Uncharacterized protein n=1 Tax=Morus notabilis TaxID=981085 RepID=W9SRG7_9ROSA|nr:hypothetical protein L484_007081 [Morus notabilis]